MGYRLTQQTETNIRDKIKDLYDEGVDLRTYSIQKSDHKRIYWAACHRFGNWKKALSKAGIKYKQLEAAVREKRKQRLLEEIRQAYNAGVELNTKNIINNKEYARLYRGARCFYKGRFFWDNALTDAGIDPEKVVKQMKWDKKKIKLSLKARRIHGKALNSGAVKDDDPRLCAAIIQHFDSFDDALRYAGFNPDTIRKISVSYTDSEILTEIIAYSLKGVDLSYGSIFSKDNEDIKLKRLYSVAGKRFKGWHNALKLCGIYIGESKKNIRWNREKVELEIIKLFDEGEPLNSIHARNNHVLLYKAAYRYYGSWRQALEACGLDYKEINKKGVSLSTEEIIASIKRFAEEDRNLNPISLLYDKDLNVRKVYIQASRKFENGWNEALENAGLNPSEIRLKNSYTMSGLAKNIRELEERGVSLKPCDLLGTENEKYYNAVMHRRSNWIGFLNEIGIDGSKYATRADWENGEAVLEHLREMFPAGVITGLRRRDRNLSQAARIYFGRIEKAAEKAGLVYSQSGRVTEKMLDERPEIVGIIFNHNKDFLNNIATQVYYHTKGLGLPTAEIKDLVSSSFVLFRDNLTNKPSDEDFRHYLYKEIYHGLIDMNESHFSNAYLSNKERVDELRSKAVI